MCERGHRMCIAWTVFIRLACVAIGFDRALFHCTSRRTDQAIIEKRTKEMSKTRVRYGYRRVHGLLDHEGRGDSAFIEAFNGRFRTESLSMDWSMTHADAAGQQRDDLIAHHFVHVGGSDSQGIDMPDLMLAVIEILYVRWSTASSFPPFLTVDAHLIRSGDVPTLAVRAAFCNGGAGFNTLRRRVDLTIGA